MPNFTADLTNNLRGGIQVLLKRDRLHSRTCLAINIREIKGVNHGKTNPTTHWETQANDAGGSRQAGLSLLYAQRVKEAEEGIAREHEL